MAFEQLMAEATAKREKKEEKKTKDSSKAHHKHAFGSREKHTADEHAPPPKA